MNAKAKLVLAILAVAFLVLKPIGACASMSVTSLPSHPCCPRAPVAPEDCAKTGCVCVSPTPGTTLVPPNIDEAQVLALTTDATWKLSPTVGERHTFGLVLFAPDERYLSYHQLLL